MDVKTIIWEQFINPVRKAYGDILKIGYEYDDFSDLHYVWHTNRELEYNDPQFRKFTGRLQNKLFDDYEIVNFAFNYDADMAELLREFTIDFGPEPLSIENTSQGEVISRLFVNGQDVSQGHQGGSRYSPINTGGLAA